MIDTPIAGLVNLELRDPTLSEVTRRAAAKPAELALVGPAAARPFVASAMAQGGPLLVVTATGREADDLTAELRGVFGDAAALFPSWETLPHERLSPGGNGRQAGGVRGARRHPRRLPAHCRTPGPRRVLGR